MIWYIIIYAFRLIAVFSFLFMAWRVSEKKDVCKTIYFCTMILLI